MASNIKGFIVGSLLACISGLSFAQQAIMPTGDSITGGQDRPSYRLPLLDELAASGCSVDMVGDQTLNSFDFRDPLGSPGSHVPPFEPAQGYDTDHQAFPGIRTEQLLNGTSSAFYTVSPLSAYVSAEQPDFVLLHTGTNDLNLAISTGTDTVQEIDTWANQTTGEVDSMIDQIFASHSNPASLRVLLANFIPYQGPFVNQSQIDAAAQASAVFTQKLEDLVAAKGNPRLLIVDVATGFDVATMTTDNVHPNQIGEEHIAGAFLPVLYGAGLCSANNIPFITSPANGDTVNGEPLTINWDDNGFVADNWQVFVGDTQSGNSSTWLDSGVLGTGVRSVTVPTLPQDGSNVFISLNYTSGGVTNQIITRFVSEPAGVTGPTITSPMPGTVLPGSDVTFNWADNGTTATQWYFRIGSTFGGEDYVSTRITNGAQRSAAFSGLPTDGSRVFVEFSHRLPSGVWVSDNVEYDAAGAPGNIPPVAADDALGPVDVNQTLNLDVLANDTDSDGTLDVSTVTITVQPTEGTATVLASGLIEYVHGGGATSGTDTLSYTVSDDDGDASNVALVTIAVNDPVTGNIPPIAVDDAVGPGTIGGSLTFDVLGNDSDSDGTLVAGTVTITTPPQVGTAEVEPDGLITYTHNGTPGTMQDVLSYTVEDDDGAVSNAATVTISPFSDPGPTECPAVMPLGNLDNGVAARDFATGTGWLMWSSENVKTRFSPAPHPRNAEQLIAVQYASGTWQVDTNDALTPFTPASDDCLVAELDFDADTVTLLAGVDQLVNGIDSGYSSGDLVVTPNQWSGKFNLGEYGLSGTSISKDTVVTNTPPVATDDVTGAINVSQSLNVDVLANDSDTDGTLDTTSVTITAQPSEGTATALASGQIEYVHGGGTTSGSDSFTYTVDDDDGDTSNVATVTVSINDPGPTQCPAVMPLGNLDNGVAARDFATGTGWLMWSSENVKTRFSPAPHPRNAEQLIVVQYVSGTWQVDNNTVLTPFIPASDDCLVAELDFDADTVTLLVGVDQIVNGIDSGYASGDLAVTPNQWGGAANQGEYGISGTSIGDNQGGSNLPPVADDDTAGPVDLGQTLSIDVLTNDSDTDGTLDTTSVTITTQPSEGTATALANGQVGYVHGGGTTSGSDSFTYTVNDDDGDTSNVATVTVSIDAPGPTQCPAVMPLGNLDNGVAARDFATGTGWLMWSSENVKTRFSPAPHPRNAEQLIVVQYVSGTWQVDNNSVLTPFIPASDDCLVAELDFDADTVTLLVGVDQIVNGIDSGYASGDLAVTPNQWGGAANQGEYGISGTSIGDNQGGSNLPPVADDDTAGPVDLEQTLSIDVLTNDSDTDGTLDTTSVTITTQPSEGTATALANGQVEYVHGGGTTSGSDSFTYTVNDDDGDTSNVATVTVSINDPGGPNTPPTAVNDATSPVDVGQTLSIDVLANDSDSDGTLDTGSLTITAQPSEGTAMALANGQVEYVHGGGTTSGSDSFTYTVNDDDGDTSNVATVTVPINDPGSSNVPPVAADDSAGPMNIGESLTFPVLANDTDSDGTIDISSITFTGQPQFGTVTARPDGLITYVHTGTSPATDFVTYTVRDNAGATSNSATVTISPIQTAGSLPELTNPAPDTQLPGEDVTFNWATNGQPVQQWYIRVGLSEGSTEFADIRFTNPATTQLAVNGLPTDGTTTIHVEFSYRQDNVWNIRNFEYIAADGGPPPPPSPPVANDDTAGPLISGQSITVDVLANDTNTDGTLTVTVVMQPAVGSVVVEPDGQITYTHDGTQGSIQDVFTYTVQNDDGVTSNVATVTISPINEPAPENEAPVAVDDTAGPIDEGQSITIDVSANDTDSDGTVEPTTVTVMSAPSAGTAVVETDGQITYTHNGASGTGSDTFTYTVQDDDGATSNVASVTITPINDGGPQPELTDPSPGTQLGDTSVTFNWDANGVAVERWYFRAGLSVGTEEFIGTAINDPSTTQLLVTGLPSDGVTTVHVEFSYQLNGSWITRNFQYTAALVDTPPPVEPPPLVLSEVNWLHADVSGWAETAALSSVPVDLSADQLCLNYDQANTWPAGQPLLPANDAELVANAWVFIWNEDDNVWYGATWEWLRPGQICKTASAVDGIHIKQPPYTSTSGWEPTSGETLYFMVSGLARNNTRNVLERSAPVQVIWP